MRAFRASNWTFSESQLIITGNVRAPFYLDSMLSLSLQTDRFVFHQLILLNYHQGQTLLRDDGQEAWQGY